MDKDAILGVNSVSLPSPEEWAIVASVLMGLSPDKGVSDTAAARAAGVTLHRLKSWVENARNAGPEAEPWVKTIPQIWDSRREEQQGLLEDVLWNTIAKGVEKINLLKLICRFEEIPLVRDILKWELSNQTSY